ncbi:hypothetical protein J2T12_002385 [Paenibacillus anaericanus]|nr:hypothetical protein [Paenibacillus anaericanus]
MATQASKAVTFNAASGTISLSMKENYNPEKTPPGFIGLNKTEKSQYNRNISSINVNQELSKDGDYFVGKGGSVELVIGGETHNFSIQSSLISHYLLKSGQNLLTGSFETKMNDTNGKSVSATISFAGIVETGEEIFLVPLGTIEEGQVVLAFGDDKFATQEIQELIREQANIEGDSF